MTARASNVVKFPTGRIVRKRYLRCDETPERVELEAALDSIYNAITALQRQKASVLVRLHAYLDARTGIIVNAAHSARHRLVRGEPGGLDALLMAWVALRESCAGKTDEEVARITDEMASVERQILAGNPTTESDRRALAAMAVIGARDGVPYANADVLQDVYQRLVIDRMTDPVCRAQEERNGRMYVERAKAHLAELGLSDDAEPGGTAA